MHNARCSCTFQVPIWQRKWSRWSECFSRFTKGFTCGGGVSRAGHVKPVVLVRVEAMRIPCQMNAADWLVHSVIVSEMEAALKVASVICWEKKKKEGRSWSFVFCDRQVTANIRKIETIYQNVLILWSRFCEHKFLLDIWLHRTARRVMSCLLDKP